ncbi:MAG: hypothetical protein ACO1SV_19315 [Fimbriimonas sp.]
MSGNPTSGKTAAAKKIGRRRVSLSAPRVWQAPVPSGKRTYAQPDYRWDFLGKRSLVECPKCGRPVVIEWNGFDAGAGSLRCTGCGYVRDRSSQLDRPPLWLQTNYRGHVLWAYNREHLAFLEDAIAAELRPGSPSGMRGLRNKLPKWMLLAKNREGLLKAIEKIRAKKPRPI